MIKITMTGPRIWQFMSTAKITRNLTCLTLGRISIMLYKDQPVAAVEDQIIFYPDSALDSGTIRAVNALGIQTQVRCTPENFDYIIAQAMLRLAMPLTRKEDNES